MEEKNITTTNITTEMRDCYIDYAMSVIIGRALPDVRDGMKPVHRRILYAMHELGLTPERGFRKSVRIVGDVLGKFHPHGDASVYEALVRMAQDFSMRYPTVMGHGNFGSVDGDSPAAMRYTEAKMDTIALEMLRDINKDTVEFVDNFDGSETEPEVLPSRFPHLLVNGSQGIAVGMATNMPPHNLAEVIDATISYIDRPTISTESLMKKLKGPDFPTGGEIIGVDGIKEAYNTGRGKIVLRGKAHIEKEKRGKSLIIITELPYMVNKSKLHERIDELKRNKKIEGIGETRDESDFKQGIRLVIETKKDYSPEYILSQLYKETDLETRYGIINLALVPDKIGNLHPKILTLKELLKEYVAHQELVIRRRTQYDLNRAERRSHILEGLLIALDHIDQVIKIIRGSKNASTAKKALRKEFSLSEEQVTAILDMRLQRLTGLERDKVRKEFEELQKAIENYKKILSDPKEVDKVVKKELREIKKKYGDERRTEISEKDNLVHVDFARPVKLLMLGLSVKGYLYPLKGKKKEFQIDDPLILKLQMNNVDNLLLISNTGKAFMIKGEDLENLKSTGVHLNSLIQIEDSEEIVGIIPVSDADRLLAIATKNGLVKLTTTNLFDSFKKSGILAINLKNGDEVRAAKIVEADETLIFSTKKGYALKTTLTGVTPTGRNSAGVKAINLIKDDELINMSEDQNFAAVILEDGYGKLFETSELKEQNRGGRGLKVAPKDKQLAAFLSCQNEDTDIILKLNTGVEITELKLMERTKKGEKVTDGQVQGAYVLETESVN